MSAQYEVMEAVVQVGDVETPVLRCGRGSATVLLVVGDPAERRRLAAALGAEARVVAVAGCDGSCSAGAAPSLGLGLCLGLGEPGGGGVCDCAERIARVVEGLGVIVTLVATSPDAQWVGSRTAALLDVRCVSVQSLEAIDVRR